MARKVKGLVQGSWKESGIDIPQHREHRSAKGRRKNRWAGRIAKMNKERKLKRFLQEENKELLHVG